MTTVTSSEVLSGVIQVIEGLSGEWDYSGPVSPDTRFYADMGLRSLDFAILASATVRRYGRLPLDKFYAQLSELPPEEREVTVRDFADFVCANLGVQSS